VNRHSISALHVLRQIKSTLSLQIRGTHLECSIAQAAVIWSTLYQIWPTFKAPPDYMTTHATTWQKTWSDNKHLESRPRNFSFHYAPLSTSRLRELVIPWGRVPHLLQREGNRGGIYSRHFLTCLRSWHMSIQPLTNVRRVATSRIFKSHLRISNGSGD